MVDGFVVTLSFVIFKERVNQDENPELYAHLMRKAADANRPLAVVEEGYARAFAQRVLAEELGVDVDVVMNTFEIDSYMERREDDR